MLIYKSSLKLTVLCKQNLKKFIYATLYSRSIVGTGAIPAWPSDPHPYREWRCEADQIRQDQIDRGGG